MTASRPGAARRLPSIRTRLANALAVWSVVWGMVIGAAVWLAAVHEVDELLDDTLQTSAELMAALVDLALPPARAMGGSDAAPGQAARFAWQVTAADGTLVLHSPMAPAQPWRSSPGFGHAQGWRLYGLTLASGQLLTVAQSEDERHEARVDVALSAVLAALAVGLLGHVWLRSKLGAELRPLRGLSERLAAWNIDRDPGLQSIGEATRRELQPVHRSLSILAQRLATRLADERAFSAHAAHALRTPLAGIDAQLAVALRDCPDGLRSRLQRVRAAAHRLQTVVTALIGLFRSSGEIRRLDLDLASLVARLPTPSLMVHVEPGARVSADPDLIAAALSNLLDNAQREGASQVTIAAGPGNLLRLADDGPGVTPAQREALQLAVDRHDGGESLGLGLMLAERVARAHGGRLSLPPAERGFAVELELDARALA